MAEEDKKLFKAGNIVVTNRVKELIKSDRGFSRFAFISIGRHLNGDWGDISEEDKVSNDEAVDGGGRLVSAYKRIDDGLLIITEADRSATTIMFPDEY